MLTPVPSRCYRCHVQTESSSTCAKCRSKSKLSNVWVSTQYDALPRLLVTRLKFERAQGAAQVIAALMAETLPHFESQTVITFVSTATSRRRQRGYDQAELIARELSKITGLTFSEYLRRYGQSRQVGSSRKTRQKQLSEAFGPQKLDEIQGKEVLLVDDIVTTGATLEAAAEVLRKSGAKKIYATTFAQKI